jgi:lipopolysaccharide/colanic/teichoic acid biosynthesis glycosyltransferase
VNELQFAIDSGDREFAPAMKTLLREAIHLSHNFEGTPSLTYQSAILSIKATYATLLALEVQHPVGNVLQERYLRNYAGNFWDFLETERLLARGNSGTHQVVSSAANLSKNGYFVVKRAIDFTLASLLLLLTAPLLLLVAIILMLDSQGAPFVAHERVGVKRRTRSGMTVWEIRRYQVVKFRTMHELNDRAYKAFIDMWTRGAAGPAGNGRLPSAIGSRDPRLTRVGHILKKTHIDGLPQLFNVWRGEMSLVGPRPVSVYEAGQYDEAQRERLATLPGMTGLAQVKGRGVASFNERLAMDIAYVRQQSAWLDLKLVLLTLPAVVGRMWTQ